MNHTIFAWTEPTPPGGLPAYVNISRDEQGRHTITTRARGTHESATAEIPVEALESLLGDLAADLYRDDAHGVKEGPKCERCHDTGWHYRDAMDPNSLEPCCEKPAAGVAPTDGSQQ